MKPDLYWIHGSWPGRVAIMPRPRGGDWLEDEVVAWQKAGVNVVVSLLTDDEINDLDLAAETELCEAHEIEFLTLPIPDRGVPESKDVVANLVTTLAQHLNSGRNVAIHCRQGIGRAAVVAAVLLAALGVDPESAIERIRRARGCDVPETAEQSQWVVDFAKSYLAAA